MCPDNNKTSLLSYFLFSLGVFAMYAGVAFGNILEVAPGSILATLIIPFLAFCTSVIHWFINSTLISIWLTKFIFQCKVSAILAKNNTQDLLEKAQDILFMYKNLDKTFGFYFVFCFTIFQLNWITVLYLGVTAYFAKYEAQFTLLFGAGALTTALGGEYYHFDVTL